MKANSDAPHKLLSSVEHISPTGVSGLKVSFFGRELSDRIVSLCSSDLRTLPTPPTSDDVVAGFKSVGISLCLPKQVHGAKIIEARWDDARSEADAVIASQGEISSQRMVGVITADCLPVVLLTKTKVGVIHAGWRGLAARIISKTAAKLDEPILHCAIGPCAGPGRYSVGEEVIAEIGTTARYSRGESILLDLAATALAELQPWISTTQVFVSGVCTISNSRFFSHRRDRECAGRNLTLISI